MATENPDATRSFIQALAKKAAPASTTLQQGDLARCIGRQLGYEKAAALLWADKVCPKCGEGLIYLSEIYHYTQKCLRCSYREEIPL